MPAEAGTLGVGRETVAEAEGRPVGVVVQEPVGAGALGAGRETGAEAGEKAAGVVPRKPVRAGDLGAVVKVEVGIVEKPVKPAEETLQGLALAGWPEPPVEGLEPVWAEAWILEAQEETPGLVWVEAWVPNTGLGGYLEVSMFCSGLQLPSWFLLGITLSLILPIFLRSLFPPDPAAFCYPHSCLRLDRSISQKCQT